MASIVPGFEYDIFISYRHKDNRYDGWVTDFVTNLKREIGATFKEDISVYFDSNPYDGLLETHNVDKSLETKLKSVVFIPVISQTYCDANSFAWRQEFCVFNRQAKEDPCGRDIRLSHGNVASRILPAKIHDLDLDDHSTIEKELGGPLRAIEFIYKSAGVNRPLRADDKREDNVNRLFYRDQINKVANAAKEIIYGIKFPGRKDMPEERRMPEGRHEQLGIKDTPKEVAKVNPEANELFLKGRHAMSLWGVDGYRAATGYFKQAITKDPEFAQAYSYLATSYAARMSWNGDLSPNEAAKNIEKYLAEAWKRGPSDSDFLTKALLEFFFNKDFAAAEKLFLQALQLNPANASSLYIYSHLLNMTGRFEEGLQFLNRAKNIEPLTVPYYHYQTIYLYVTGRFEEAMNTIIEALRLYPSVLSLHNFLARIYLCVGRNEDAIEVILAALASSRVRPPSMVAWLAAAYGAIGKEDKCKELTEELIERSESDEKGVNVYLAYLFSIRGDRPSAIHWLEQARASNDVDMIWWQVDPLFKNLREEISHQQK